MKNDILPPRKPSEVEPTPPEIPPSLYSIQPALPEVVPFDDTIIRTHRKKSWVVLVISGVTILLLCIAAIAALWYGSALSPVAPGDESRKRVIIESGSTVDSISVLLEEQGLIKSRLAFSIHARTVNAGSHLKAGQYSLSPSESTQEILEHIVSGNVDQFSITFLPGSTLRRLKGETSAKHTDVKSALLSAGYDEKEIEAAFSKTYDHPLLISKPANADLEGYIFGETYNFASSSSVEQILIGTFDEYHKFITNNRLEQRFKEQGLSLHEGIILASVIQREVSEAEDQRQVAQIFLDRLSIGMPLGADATFEYGAKKEGIAASPSIDSPYNTRKFTGFPPGPIAMPGRTALFAVASPAEGDYLYFVSGDDGKNYFSKTNEEHEAKVQKYCRKLCFGL